MTVKELIHHLEQYEQEIPVWFYIKLKGKVMPEEITSPVAHIYLTEGGVLLTTEEKQ